MDFDSLYEQYKPEIDRLVYRQYVPGFDPDDLAAEMAICLWQASLTYSDDYDVEFGVYWWSVWLNHRISLLRAYYRQKRVHAIPVAELPEQPCEDAHALPLPKVSTRAKQVWDLLGKGYKAGEVQEVTGMSMRNYYTALRHLHTAENYYLLSTM